MLIVDSAVYFRRLYVPPSRPPWKRTWFLVISGIVMFLFIIYIMASLGRRNMSDESFGSADERNFPHN